MVKHIAFTLYPVTNMSRARQFYEETLGLRLTARRARSSGFEYDLDGGTFALTTSTKEARPAPMQAEPSPSKYRTSTRWFAQLRAKGVQVKLEPLSTPVCRLAVILDSEGNALTLHQVTQPW